MFRKAQSHGLSRERGYSSIMFSAAYAKSRLPVGCVCRSPPALRRWRPIPGAVDLSMPAPGTAGSCHVASRSAPHWPACARLMWPLRSATLQFRQPRGAGFELAEHKNASVSSMCRFFAAPSHSLYQSHQRAAQQARCPAAGDQHIRIGAPFWHGGQIIGVYAALGIARRWCAIRSSDFPVSGSMNLSPQRVSDQLTPALPRRRGTFNPPPSSPAIVMSLVDRPVDDEAGCHPCGHQLLAVTRWPVMKSFQPSGVRFFPNQSSPALASQSGKTTCQGCSVPVSGFLCAPI